VNDDIVRAHPVPQARGERGDRFLEPLVLKGGDTPAAIADDVVVMVPAGKCRLVARDPAPDVDPLNQLEIVKQLDRAIDTRERCALTTLPQSLPDLLS
jgi:hypothetical protein